MCQKQALFLTGTDTDVGKTTLAAALCYAISKAGLNPKYYKPVLSGAQRINSQLVGGDLEFVKTTARMSNDQLTCSYMFEPAVSPHLAAKMTGITIDPQRLVADFDQIAETADPVIIEGAGGAACPLSSEAPVYTLAHLMAQFNVPTAIVCRAGLGTLHHTAATLAYLKPFNLQIAGLFVSGYEDTALCNDNLQMLTQMTGLPILAVLPQLETCTPEALRAAVDQHWDCQDLIRRLLP